MPDIHDACGFLARRIGCIEADQCLQNLHGRRQLRRAPGSILFQLVIVQPDPHDPAPS
ncbi:hypothetical protein [Paenibacillus lutimineralis]|uniref:hypothetical protein n=1 Tax=Paenibacillus lutimineralis TaxID=2707005 RepID=UPI001D04E4AE|nr:hypothetical protein [Paenibacillus lutimineralis]